MYPDKRPEEYEDAYVLQVEDALDEITRPVEYAGGKVAGAQLRVGDDVAREVLRLGEAMCADLIVLGGRDLGLIERLVGGSVREALVARTSIPVLAVREGERSWPPARVVVWDDSSEGARLAGELAVGIEGLYGASVVLLHVLPGAREAKGYHEDSEEPFARWAARLERLGGGRPETRPVAGASGKAALSAVAGAPAEGPALLALGAVEPGVPKRALRAVGDYEWMVFVFGAFLIYTGIRMAFHRDSEVHPERNPVLRLVRRLLPMTKDFEGERFFTRHAGKLMATPLFAVIVVVGTTDMVFAVDSILAIFAITSSAFIVWTANAFAVLGLRPLYFMLAGMMDRFVYLQTGLAVVLVFVGAKFIYSYYFGKLPIWISLPFIATVVAVSIGASLYKTRGLNT